MYLQIYILVSIACYVTFTSWFSKSEEPHKEQRQIAFIRSLGNLAILGLISVPLTYMRMADFPHNNDNPIWKDVLFIIVWAIMGSFIFAITHFALHSKILWPFHKQHHQNNPSYSTSCLDAHPIEFLFGNVSAVALPMYIFVGSEVASLLWTMYAMLNTVMGHALEGEHQIHHKRFRWNYGAQPYFIFDRMMGTYKPYSKE
jgi:sterol desaturase/sphingolipid hydroxylase (fatty acid hydroxylase superfamily)